MESIIDDLECVISNLQSLANKMYKLEEYDMQSDIEDEIHLLGLIVDNVEETRDEIAKLV